MANTILQQKKRNNPTNQQNDRNVQKTHLAVRQDRARFASARLASQQPAAVTKPQRARQVNTAATRSQNHPTRNQKAVQITLWVKPIVKAELQRLAEQNGLHLSPTGAALLERAVQQNVDMQYGALLEPIIKQVITREMKWRDQLNVRNTYYTAQIRYLVSNILDLMPGMTDEMRTAIIRKSEERAKDAITTLSPQIADLIKAFEKLQEEEEEKANGGGTA